MDSDPRRLANFYDIAYSRLPARMKDVLVCNVRVRVQLG